MFSNQTPLFGVIVGAILAIGLVASGSAFAQKGSPTAQAPEANASGAPQGWRGMVGEWRLVFEDGGGCDPFYRFTMRGIRMRWEGQLDGAYRSVGTVDEFVIIDAERVEWDNVKFQIVGSRLEMRNAVASWNDDPNCIFERP